MKVRVKKFEDVSPLEFLVLRDSLGLKRYRKSNKRDKEEREVLLELGLKKIKEKVHKEKHVKHAHVKSKKPAVKNALA